MKYFLPVLPLSNGNPDKVLISNIKEVVKSNLKNLILTSPGEKVSDAGFGVGAKHFLFQQMNGSATADLQAAIMKQTNKYMPFLTIRNVHTRTVERQTNEVRLSISYFVKPLSITDELVIKALSSLLITDPAAIKDPIPLIQNAKITDWAATLKG